MSKKKNKKNLRDTVSEMFISTGYNVKEEAFSDKSASWLLISKKESPEINIELSFDYKGKEFFDFNIWQDIIGVIESKKIV